MAAKYTYREFSTPRNAPPVFGRSLAAMKSSKAMAAGPAGVGGKSLARVPTVKPYADEGTRAMSRARSRAPDRSAGGDGPSKS